MTTTKVKITEDILEELNILESIRKLQGGLDCNKWYDLEYLATRCNTKNYELVIDILEKLGAEITENS